MMKKIIFFLSIAWLLSSCEKTVQLDLNQSSSSVVIEGLLTDVPGKQFVKITRAYGFYTSGTAPRITDAVVSMEDENGTQMDFIHNPEDEDTKNGYYYPVDSDFAGTVGHTYTLTVVADGQTYTATDKMEPVTDIDSLGYRVNKDEQKDPRFEGKFYELLFYAKEPQDRTDYYLFKFYENDTLRTYTPTDIYYADDKTLGENINGVESPVYYAVGDTATMEMYSLTREGYLFYNDLSTLLTSDGGMFSPPPANCRTNLTNNALGLFQVSALKSATLIIRE